MNLCPVCYTPLRNYPTVMHHWRWPKKKWHGKNHLIEVHAKCEKAYHIFWYENCQNQRICVDCKYANICCYREKR